MMFATLRMLGLVRRGIRALESLARSQSELADVARNRRLQREARAARKPVPAELGVMDMVEVERRFQERLKVENLERG